MPCLIIEKQQCIYITTDGNMNHFLFIGDTYVVPKKPMNFFLGEIYNAFVFFLTDWIDVSGHKDEPAFETLEPEALASLLKEFYYCVWNKTGERHRVHSEITKMIPTPCSRVTSNRTE